MESEVGVLGHLERGRGVPFREGSPSSFVLKTSMFVHVLRANWFSCLFLDQLFLRWLLEGEGSLSGTPP